MEFPFFIFLFQIWINQASLCNKNLKTIKIQLALEIFQNID